jgi:hypothetical protein
VEGGKGSGGAVGVEASAMGLYTWAIGGFLSLVAGPHGQGELVLAFDGKVALASGGIQVMTSR